MRLAHAQTFKIECSFTSVLNDQFKWIYLAPSVSLFSVSLFSVSLFLFSLLSVSLFHLLFSSSLTEKVTQLPHNLFSSIYIKNEVV